MNVLSKNKQLVSTAVAFVAGISVGGIAFGQKTMSDSERSDIRSAQQSEPTVHRRPTGDDAADSTATAAPANEQDLATSLSSSTSAAVSATVEPTGEVGQLQAMTTRWMSLENQVRSLTQRLAGLERRLANRAAGQERPSALTVIPARTSEDRQQALVSAGVSAIQAQELVWRQSDLELARLELRDQAIREGWFQDERYFEELRALNDNGLDLRAEIGEQAYDSYLFQSGTSNRVQVTSVIPGSAAELSDIRPGDIIESYAGENIYSYRDLRSVTTQGDRGDQVPVTIRRDNETIEAWVARGPVGVTLEPTSSPPNG